MLIEEDRAPRLNTEYTVYQIIVLRYMYMFRKTLVTLSNSNDLAAYVDQPTSVLKLSLTGSQRRFDIPYLRYFSDFQMGEITLEVLR